MAQYLSSCPHVGSLRPDVSSPVGEHGSEDCGIRGRREPTPWHGRRRCLTSSDRTRRCPQQPPGQRTDVFPFRPDPTRTQGSLGFQGCRKGVSNRTEISFRCFLIRYRMRPESLSGLAGFSERRHSNVNAWSVSTSDMGIRNAVNRPSEFHRDFDRPVSRYSCNSNVKGWQKPRNP